jgi:hypothetical protein
MWLLWWRSTSGRSRHSKHSWLHSQVGIVRVKEFVLHSCCYNAAIFLTSNATEGTSGS